MEAYARKKALGETVSTNSIDIWSDAVAAEEDEDGKPFTSPHAKQFLAIYHAAEKETNEKIADERKTKDTSTSWWVLKFTNREPVGDIPRIKMCFHRGKNEACESWLIDLEVAIDEEDKAMSDISDYICEW